MFIKVFTIKDGKEIVHESEYDPDDACRESPPCGGCTDCIWRQAEYYGYDVSIKKVMTRQTKTQLILAALLAILFATALLVLLADEAHGQPMPEPEEQPEAVEDRVPEVNFFEGMSDEETKSFLEAEGQLQLIKQRRRAPFSGIILTYKDFQKIWGQLQQSTIDLKAAKEHIGVLEGLVKQMQTNHPQDLLKCKDDCDKRVQSCLDAYPQPVVIPCDPCEIEWYEHPALWVSVGIVVGVVVGGGVVYLFGGS